ncbi:unnamed protein product [Paramecium sonneborni]|uniref:Uncharacterized protein n=1 Tax=Paramecium sonneborni TaxID=65129 RepID=A0A8S1QWD7_9CILI|nr:unnamed protein product [Paramecium sonneborni]
MLSDNQYIYQKQGQANMRPDSSILRNENRIQSSEPIERNNTQKSLIQQQSPQEITNYLKQNLSFVNISVRQFENSIQQLVTAFGNHVINGFRIDEFIRKFFCVLERRLNKFFDHLDQTIFQQNNQQQFTIPEDFNASEIRNHIRQKANQIPTDLLNHFQEKLNTNEIDREILRKVDQILRVYELFRSDQGQNCFINITKFNLEQLLDSTCNNQLQDIQSIEQLIESQLIISIQLIQSVVLKNNTNFLNIFSKEEILTKFYSTLSDADEKQITIDDIYNICRIVCQRDRKIIYNDFHHQISQNLNELAPDFFQTFSNKKSQIQLKREQLQNKLLNVQKQWEIIKLDENYYLIFNNRINEANLNHSNQQGLHQLQRLMVFFNKVKNLQSDQLELQKEINIYMEETKKDVQGKLSDAIVRARQVYSKIIPGKNPSNQIKVFVDTLYQELLNLLEKSQLQQNNFNSSFQQTLQSQLGKKSQNSSFLKSSNRTLQDSQINRPFSNFQYNQLTNPSAKIENMLQGQSEFGQNQDKRQKLNREVYAEQKLEYYNDSFQGKIKYPEYQKINQNQSSLNKSDLSLQDQEFNQIQKKNLDKDQSNKINKQMELQVKNNQNQSNISCKQIEVKKDQQKQIDQTNKQSSQLIQTKQSDISKKQDSPKEQIKQPDPIKKQEPPKEKPKQSEPPKKPEPPKEQSKQPEPLKKPEPPKEQPKQPEPPKKPDPPKEQPKQPEPPKKPEPPKEQPKQPEPPKKPEPPKEQPKQPEPPKKPEPPKEQPKQPEPPKKPEPPKEQPKQPEPPKKPEPPKEQPKQPEPPKKPEPPKEQPKQPEPPKKPEPPKEQPKQPEPPKKPEPPKEQPKQPEPPKKPEPPKEQPKQPEPPKKPEPPKEQPKQPEPPKKPEPPKEQPKQPEPPKKPEPPKEQPKQPEPPKKPEPPKEQPKQPEPPKKPEPPKEQPKQPEPPKKPEPPKEQPKQPEPPKMPEPPKEQPKQPEPPKKPEPPKEQPKQPEPPKMPEPPKEQPKQPEPPKKPDPPKMPEPPKEQPKQPEPPKMPEPPKEQPKQPEPPKMPEPPKEPIKSPEVQKNNVDLIEQKNIKEPNIQQLIQPDKQMDKKNSQLLDQNKKQQQFDPNELNLDDFEDDEENDIDFMTNYVPSKIQKQIPQIQDSQKDKINQLEQENFDEGEESEVQIHKLITQKSLPWINKYTKSYQYGTKIQVKDLIHQFDQYECLIQLFQQFIIQDELYFFDFEETELILLIFNKMLEEEDPKKEFDQFQAITLKNYQNRTQKQNFAENQKLYYLFDKTDLFPFDFYLIEKDPLQNLLIVYYEDEPSEETMGEQFENFLSVFQQICNCEEYEIAQIVLQPKAQQTLKNLKKKDHQYLKAIITLFSNIYEEENLENISFDEDTIARLVWVLNQNSEFYTSFEEQEEEIKQFYLDILTQGQEQDPSIEVGVIEQFFNEEGLENLQQEIYSVYQEFQKNKKTKQYLVSVNVILEEQQIKISIYCHLQKINNKNILKIFTLNHYSELGNQILEMLKSDDLFEYQIYCDFSRHSIFHECNEITLGAWYFMLTQSKMQPEEAMANLLFSLIPYNLIMTQEE